LGFALAEFGKGRTEESEAWLTRALDRISAGPQPHFRAGFVFDSIGRAYTLGGKYQRAQAYLNRSAEVFARTEDKAQLVGTLVHRSALFERTHDWKSAHQDAVRAVQLAAETQLEHLCRTAQQRLDELEIPRYRIPGSGSPFHGIVFTSDIMKTFV